VREGQEARRGKRAGYEVHEWTWEKEREGKIIVESIGGNERRCELLHGRVCA
jgi:hypothetical protein